MHPSARIILYILSALALPGLSLSGALIVVFVLLTYHLVIQGMHATRRLAVRARWLFLLITLGYAYGLPGEAVLPVLGNFSPSLPGFLAGLRQAGNLLALLLLLDVLVLSQSEDQLLAGVHGLFARLSRFGVHADRITVRLALTLRAMASRPIQSKFDIFEVLKKHDSGDIDDNANTDPTEAIRLKLTPWHWRDQLLISLATAGLGGFWIWKATCA